MSKRLQAEFWETQVWLMWILAVLLGQTGHRVLMWAVIVYSIFTLLGVITKIAQAVAEDRIESKLDKLVEEALEEVIAE